MLPLNHIVEPIGLLLTWQPADERASNRTRRTVAEIRRDPETGVSVFRYLKDAADFEKATAAGFQGFPTFSIAEGESSRGVLDPFLRRLPPRARADFDRYLGQHRLPVPFDHSDFALLGYTGARLPSDGFGLVPVFPEGVSPCDVIVEVAGLRHVFKGDPSSIHPGDAVHFALDPENPVDSDAVAIMWQGQRLGFINRALRSAFVVWLRERTVSAHVERVNGKPERPLVFVRVSVR